MDAILLSESSHAPQRDVLVSISGEPPFLSYLFLNYLQKNPELYPFNKKSDSGKRQDPRAFVVSVLTQGGKQQAIKPWVFLCFTSLYDKFRNLLPKPKIAPKPVKSTPQEETAGEEDPTAKEIARLKEELRNAQDQYDIAENETMQVVFHPIFDISFFAAWMGDQQAENADYSHLGRIGSHVERSWHQGETSALLGAVGQQVH